MDTLLRHWHMLKHIPRYPQKVSTADLEKWLKNDGFETSRRTIQRDLDKLSLEFPPVYRQQQTSRLVLGEECKDLRPARHGHSYGFDIQHGQYLPQNEVTPWLCRLPEKTF